MTTIEKMTAQEQKAYDEGMTAAAYSLGLSSCKYEFGTAEFKAWLNGYRYQYTRS